MALSAVEVVMRSRQATTSATDLLADPRSSAAEIRSVLTAPNARDHPRERGLPPLNFHGKQPRMIRVFWISGAPMSPPRFSMCMQSFGNRALWVSW